MNLVLNSSLTLWHYGKHLLPTLSTKFLKLCKWLLTSWKYRQATSFLCRSTLITFFFTHLSYNTNLQNTLIYKHQVEPQRDTAIKTIIYRFFNNWVMQDPLRLPALDTSIPFVPYFNHLIYLLSCKPARVTY